MTVIEYVTEEVRRQGHDVHALDGIERVGWMLGAWSMALEWSPECKIALYRGKFRTLPKIALYRVRELGRIVEPNKNLDGFRKVGVRVGSRICPPPAEVQDRLKRLLELEPSMTPLEFYKEFELIHPFVDGNGRTGKILLNWKNNSLLNPIFPPSDLFGLPIVNP